MYRTASESVSQSLERSSHPPGQPPESTFTRQAQKRLFRYSVFAIAMVIATLSGVCSGNDTWHRLHPDTTRHRVAVPAGEGWQKIQPRGGGASADESLPTGAWQKALPLNSVQNNAATQSVAEPAAVGLPDNMQLIEIGDHQGKAADLPDRATGAMIENITNQSSQPFDEPGTINLDLFVGQVKVLGQVDVHRVAVGNGGIIRAEVLDNGELLVIAAAPGSSSLRLWHKDQTQTDYNIRVAETDPETRVPLERMVRMRVRMVEFRKSALGRLGIDWNDSAAGPSLAAAGEASTNQLLRPTGQGFDALSGSSSSVSAYFGIASNITSKINLLSQNGDAVTLAEPVLSAMNGGQASFLAGGEVPYPSVGENGQTQVEFKEYGIKLDVAPLIDAAGHVRTLLETEISQLDASVSVQGTPGLLTRRAQTEVTVRSGQTIVISGLLSSDSGADANMIPGLGKLPIIGRLFGSRSRRNTLNELVIFVTPEVIEPGQAMINAREQSYLDVSDRRVESLRQQLQLME